MALVHKNSSPYTNEIIAKAKLAMKKDSYFLISDAYSKEFCDEIKAYIDEVSSGIGVEINYSGTETRIWSAQKRFSGIKRFFDESNKFVSSVIEKKI